MDEYERGWIAGTQYKPSPGDTIADACVELWGRAPAYMIFNEIRIEATGGESPGDLVDRYRAECDRRSVEHAQKRAEWEKTPQGQQLAAAAAEAKRAEEAVQAETLSTIDRLGLRERYPWTPDMGEISGFGGGYEAACRTMVYAGLAWLETHGGAWDEKAIDEAIMVSEPGCSGAMHGAAMAACRFIHANGWPTYQARMRRAEASS